MKPPKARVAFFLISIFLVPSLILVSAVFSHRKELRYATENSPQAFAEHQKVTLAAWATNTYVSLQLTDEIKYQISDLISSNSNRHLLSERQGKMLGEEFFDLFNAYSAGSYEAYCRFRMPPNVTWAWKTNGCGYVHNQTGAKEELDRYFKKGPIFLAPLFIYSFRTNYGFYPTHKITRAAPDTMDARFKEYVFQYSNCSFYSNFWTGVCFSKGRLILTQTKTTPVRLGLMPFFPKQAPKASTVEAPFPNLGYISSKYAAASLLEFKNSIKTIQDNTGDVLIADSFFFIETSAPDSPVPVMVRFYWSPNDERWLPDELICGTLLSFVHRFPIF